MNTTQILTLEDLNKARNYLEDEIRRRGETP